MMAYGCTFYTSVLPNFGKREGKEKGKGKGGEGLKSEIQTLRMYNSRWKLSHFTIISKVDGTGT